MTNRVDKERASTELKSIYDRAVEFESIHADELAVVHPQFKESARNLVHYLALRQSDLRGLQETLSSLGLSSLGRSERNVLGSLRVVSTALGALRGEPASIVSDTQEELALDNAVARRHKEALLGAGPPGRDASIMVTMPTEAGDNKELVAEMLAAGMNVARINCAMDDEATWQRIVDNLREAAKESNTECRINMDLGGPKLRTGPLEPGPKVLHIKPRRGPMGRIIAPRRVRLVPKDFVQRGTKSACIPVPCECIELAEVGDEIRYRDTRGKKRRLMVVEKDEKGLVLEAHKGAYIQTGSRLRLIRSKVGEKIDYRIGELPAIERPLRLRVGDTLRLTGDGAPGTPASETPDGTVIECAKIACQQPEVFQYLAPGEPVSLNDGKISGVVISADDEQVDIEITKAKPAGSPLRGNKGINFPKSDIPIAGLTSVDRQHLPFIARNADAVSLSFVRDTADIDEIVNELDKLGATELGVIVKIETKRGFKNLPQLILSAMRRYPIAVMIARGDLAVECGWERLAELQEEILWMCEAARVPVIWATQVLEQETKRGLPSRAEITDAAMSQRADCVMLNKGPHILAAIRTLDNILRRMKAHQFKKTARMRKLRVSGDD